MTKKIAILLAATATMSFASPVLADTPAFTYTGGTTILGNPPYTLGYAFTAANPFTVTALGLLDEGGDGLASSHDIGLFDSAGTLLASTMLAAGTGGTLVNGFRYTSISATSLGAGSYAIGAVYADGNDPLGFPFSGILTGAPGFTFDHAAYAGGGALAYPAVAGGTTDNSGYVGPNFLTGAVPEPATWAMMVFGFGMIGFGLRRRGKQSVRVTYA